MWAPKPQSLTDCCNHYWRKNNLSWYTDTTLRFQLPQYGALLSAIRYGLVNPFIPRRWWHICSIQSAGDTWPSSSYQISLSWLSVSIKNQCWIQTWTGRPHSIQWVVSYRLKSIRTAHCLPSRPYGQPSFQCLQVYNLLALTRYGGMCPFIE